MERCTFRAPYPAGEVSSIYGAIAAKVVQEVAKLGAGPRGALQVDDEGAAGVSGALRCQLAGTHLLSHSYTCHTAPFAQLFFLFLSLSLATIVYHGTGGHHVCV